MQELKVATAIAILRSKPENVSAKQYVQKLCDDYELAQEQWRIRYLQAKDVILQMKQQQIALSLTQNVCSGTNIGHARTGISLSPPCFGEYRHEGLGVVASQSHALTNSYQFIQSVVNLLGTTEKIGTLEDMPPFQCSEDETSEATGAFVSLSYSQLHSTLKETVTTCINCLQRAVEEYETGIPMTCMHQGLEGITSLLSSKLLKASPYGQLLKTSILEQLGCLIDTILVCLLEPASSDTIQPVPKRRLLQRMLTHFTINMEVPEKYAILTTVVEHVQKLCSSLRISLTQDQSFSPDCYERLGSALDCLHHGISSLGPEKADSEVLKGIQTDLEGCLLHLTQPFPFLSQVIWRLCAMIDTLLISHLT